MPEALRADAARNRRQVVDAARVVFAERGLDAPLDEIARRAGVGNATLYRRFPTRCALVAAVFESVLDEVVMATQRALAEPDPWEAFAGHLRLLCRLQAEDRAFADLIVSHLSGAPALEQLRDRAFRGLTQLIDRAQSSGDLRPDFRHEDVVVLLMANAGIIDRTAAAAPTAWRRHLDQVLAGLHASGDAPVAPLSPSPGRRRVFAAMRALADRYGCA